MKSNNENKNSIMGIMFIIWFIVSLGLMIYFSKTKNIAFLLFMFGQYFAMFGFMFLSSEEPRRRFKDVWPNYLVILVGAGLMLAGIILFIKK
jgi:hypothetical protein